ncbi:MAG: general secretion pathway protein GspK [Rhodanobacter sp.]|nr:general secretion pathway protein GspK [Rhodanobacter sp.]
MLSILLGSFSLIARTENLQSRHLFDSTQARYAAEAGLNLAIYELRKPDVLARWVGDGRAYTFGFGDAKVEVRITNDSGKVDINRAGEDILTGLFVGRGVPFDQAQALADAIQDWRESGIAKRPNGAKEADYRAAGLSYGPTGMPFRTVSEVQQVLGMTYDLYQRVEPALTIYSGSSMPNVAFAPLEALVALPGMTAECAQEIIMLRQTVNPGDPPPATTCTNASIVARGGGSTYSVKSRAVLPNGGSATLDTTIRMGGINAAGRPYMVLRWRDDETS